MRGPETFRAQVEPRGGGESFRTTLLRRGACASLHQPLVRFGVRTDEALSAGFRREHSTHLKLKASYGRRFLADSDRASSAPAPAQAGVASGEGASGR